MGTEDGEQTVAMKVEWDRDFNNTWIINLKRSLGGREGPFRLKGRCRQCWGGLIGKSGPEDSLRAIRCRVCGILLEDDAAENEYRGMLDEKDSHAFNMACEQPTKYREAGRFVCKVFPNLNRLPDDELRRRIDANASKPVKKGWLTRNEFPEGSPGFLFLQARALMSGVERLARELSVVAAEIHRFADVDISDSDIDLHDDDSATVYLSDEKLSEHPETRAYELMQGFGSTMTIVMMSAFACELAMKAIRLTREDDARKSHDLWKLYCDLPPDSRSRIEADFREVVSVLKGARHTFDRWRYFETNVGSHSISAMIDTKRAFALAKMARVLLDEAEIMGLDYSIDLEVRHGFTKDDDDELQLARVAHALHISGTEAPPRFSNTGQARDGNLWLVNGEGLYR